MTHDEDGGPEAFMCNIDGGLWPLMWATLIVCITWWGIVTRDRTK